MRRVFRLTPGQFILKVRMDEAMRRLRKTMDPLTEIAFDCGYSDQSAFTRQFHQTVGLSPGEFRQASMPK
jgi:AraC-like DNA-binding protein